MADIDAVEKRVNFMLPVALTGPWLVKSIVWQTTFRA